MNKTTIEQMILSARRNGQKEEMNVYCLVKAEFLKAEKEHGIEPDEDKCSKIIYKMMDQRRDSMKQYIEGNRKDLADIEGVELNILTTLVPKLPTESEIINLVTTIVENFKLVHENVSMKDTKEIISLVNSQMKNIPNIGKYVSNAIRMYM